MKYYPKNVFLHFFLILILSCGEGEAGDHNKDYEKLLLPTVAGNACQKPSSSQGFITLPTPLTDEDSDGGDDSCSSGSENHTRGKSEETDLFAQELDQLFNPSTGRKRNRADSSNDKDSGPPIKRARTLQSNFKVALLNQNVTYGEALKKNDLLNYRIKDDIEGAIYLQKEKVKPAPWFSFISDIIETDGEPLPEALSGDIDKIDSAVIFIETGSRKFAIPLGQGHHLLDPSLIEQDFGLYVGLNASNIEKIKGLGSQTISSNPRSTLTAYNNPVSLSQFEVSLNSLIKSISTEVNSSDDEDLSTYRMSGSGSYVQVGRKLDITTLPKICMELLEYYNRDDYKFKFPWFDNIRPVTDDSIIAALETRLLTAVKTDFGNKKWYVSTPWFESDLSYSPMYYKMGPKIQYYNFEEIAKHIYNISQKQKFNLKTLKRKVVEVYDENDRPIHQWNLYKGIVFESLLGGEKYVLHGSMWFKLNRAYADEVDSFVKSLQKEEAVSFKFPHKLTKETEGDYNRRVAYTPESPFLLFDQRLVQPTVSVHPTEIEFCDLLSQHRQLIHIKNGIESSVLSHLFAQGSVSALVLKEDSAFRKRLKDKFLRSEIVGFLKEATKPNFLKLKQKWTEQIEKGKIDDWKQKMDILLNIDKKMLGNIRKGNPFQEGTVKAKYKEDNRKKKDKKKPPIDFNEYVFNYYENYLFQELQKDLKQIGETNSDEIVDHYLEVVKKVFGIKIAPLPLQNRIKDEYIKHETILDKTISPLPKFEPSLYTVLYGIITNKTGDLNEILPFFSRVNLMEHAQKIRSLGYGVALNIIGIGD